LSGQAWSANGRWDIVKIVPITLKQAKAFIGEHHRHNRPPQGWLFGCGLEVDGELRGVATAGRPVARGLAGAIEITRVCTLGDKNACSQLYGAICRAAKALGYQTAYTYTLQAESGVTPAAAGFVIDAELKERPTWNCNARHRVQRDLFGNETRPPGPKIRWKRALARIA